MKNIHIIYANFNEGQSMMLENYGIKVGLGYNRIDIEENDTYWKLKPYLDKWKIEESIISQFTDEEIDNSKRLVFLGSWANGYPMNDTDNGYQQTTYDNSNYCKTCGMGLNQKEPFRLKKITNWGGNKKLFSLNWIFDEIFVRKDFYENVFKPIGIESKEVLLYKKETFIEDTVQLIIPATEVSLNLEGYPFEVCKTCDRKRYDLINKGFFPSFKEDVDDMQIFKSKEWFGTGASARKYIFISAKLKKEFKFNKVKASYIPCDEDGVTQTYKIVD